jgi:1-acyl-sn-glycerol-3-phosphate acyltransferase
MNTNVKVSQGITHKFISSQLDRLTQINLDDLVSSFGWQNQPLPAAIVRALFIKPARKFARQIVEYDNLVGKLGLHEASRQILQKRYVSELHVHGKENIPTSGPALFLSNHPGMTDTISLFAAINRPDLRIIAYHRPFLASLVNITKQLSFISDDPGERMRAVRQVSAHLRAGKAALTFPAGKIEPDPSVHQGALESLSNWTDSAAIFLRFSPDMPIVPVTISGVIWEKTAHHWLTRLKHTREESEKLAAALQLLAMIVRDVRPTTVHVRFAKPITASEVGSADVECIHEKLMERMRCLIESQKDGDGESVL